MPSARPYGCTCTIHSPCQFQHQIPYSQYIRPSHPTRTLPAISSVSTTPRRLPIGHTSQGSLSRHRRLQWHHCDRSLGRKARNHQHHARCRLVRCLECCSCLRRLGMSRSHFRPPNQSLLRTLGFLVDSRPWLIESKMNKLRFIRKRDQKTGKDLWVIFTYLAVF